MSKILVVPNWLSDAINGALDKAYAECPEAPQNERKQHYDFLLNFFDEHGYLPEFSLVKREAV